MPEWSVIQPSSEKQWESYYALRYEVLNKPWDQTKGSEYADDENSAIHAMMMAADSTALAVGRIHIAEPGCAQIRFMAVRPEFQGKGLGKAMLRYIEHIGNKNLGPFQLIRLQARSGAVDFYRANGYEVKEKSFMLFGSIQHYLMEKKINQQNYRS